MRIVSQNLLHGRECPPDTNRCWLPERVALFMEQLAAAACPEVVAVQEANTEVAAALAGHLDTCGYELVWDADEGIDRELVLTTLGVVDSQRVRLAGGFRTAYAVRLDSPIGGLDVLSTHLASSSDDARCDERTCPPPCPSSARLRECQALQLVELATAFDGGALTVLGGDLNAVAGEPAYAAVVDAGFVDSHLAAGQPECSPEAPLACTSGRASRSLDDLTDPASQQRRRIDFLFVEPLPPSCTIGPQTGPFNAESADGPLAFPSDHTGVMVEIVCSTVPSSAPPAPFPSTTSTLPTGTPADPGVATEVAAAFEGLFDGTEEDLSRRLVHLEDGEALAEEFTALMRAAGPMAGETSARVQAVTSAGPDAVTVLFDLLVGGAVVFDAREGLAVRRDGRWVVAVETLCDLAALLAPATPICER